MLVALSEKKFGANGFMSPAADQYEETNASLVGFSTVIKKGNFNGSQRYIGDVIKTNIFY
jgi:iron complex outermembrane receptor protein